MATLTWLHLSDWHQQGADFDRDVVRDALIKDLVERAAIDPALARVDLALFSGDLAWTGQPEEYQAAQREFLGPVLEAVDLQPDRLLLVPGNHDFDRAYACEWWAGSYHTRAGMTKAPFPRVSFALGATLDRGIGMPLLRRQRCYLAIPWPRHPMPRSSAPPNDKAARSRAFKARPPASSAP